MNHNERQTDDSILAAPADEATEQAADLVIAAADEDKLTPAKLGQLLVSVGRTVSDEDDLLTLLQRVVEIAHDAIDGADSTSLTIDLGGRTYTAVHTDDRTLRVDSEQYDAGDGPCLEASRTGTVVLVNADDPEDRWPRFTTATREEEILSFLAAPLITGEQSLGSFNLYGHARSAFDTLDAEIPRTSYHYRLTHPRGFRTVQIGTRRRRLHSTRTTDAGSHRTSQRHPHGAARR